MKQIILQKLTVKEKKKVWAGVFASPLPQKKAKLKMRKVKNLINISFLTAVLVFMSIFPGIGCQKAERSPGSTDGKITMLPEFNGVDVNGKSVKSTDFKGKWLYVQFIDSKSRDDIDLLEKVYLNWADENLAIAAIAQKPREFLALASIESDEVIVLSSDYENMKQAFASPACCETYHIFAPSGKLLKDGFNREGYEDEVKHHLDRLIKNKAFHLSNLAAENENIRNIHWLGLCRDIIEKKDKDYTIVSMFTSICSECFSGAIVKRLGDLYSTNKDRAGVLAIVPENFSDIDIENLKTFLNIDFPVERANSALEEKWQRQMTEFGAAELTNIIFLVDKQGVIVKAANKEPKRIKEFFVFVESLLKSKRSKDK